MGHILSYCVFFKQLQAAMHNFVLYMIGHGLYWAMTGK